MRFTLDSSIVGIHPEKKQTLKGVPIVHIDCRNKTITVTINGSQTSDISIDLFSLSGKMLLSTWVPFSVHGRHLISIPMLHNATGAYIVSIKFDKRIIESKKMISSP
ncbi:MAG: T9SS type A sorting domain-containing protein [Chitinivibrionales bacterium]|nr:T9SS type A sorting domain-containing protein [Chitinivibrionales bacterium]